MSTSLTGLYLTYGLFCGIGTGIVYIGIIGLMVRWFPDRRGFATGMVAAGYGFGAILTTFPIDTMMKSAGYQHTLVVFGIILGLVGAAAALRMRMPTDRRDVLPPRRPWRPRPDVDAEADAAQQGVLADVRHDDDDVHRRPDDHLAVRARSRATSASPMSWCSASRRCRWRSRVDRLTNGLTRPFFGWVSDHIGRENTMAIAFLMEAAAVTMMVLFRDNALVFVILSGVVFFGWGEIFSLFPSTLTDTFGSKYATTNYGFLYMAQGVGSVLGGRSRRCCTTLTGSWLPVFAIIIAMDALTGILALFALKPMRRAYTATL